MPTMVPTSAHATPLGATHGHGVGIQHHQDYRGSARALKANKSMHIINKTNESLGAELWITHQQNADLPKRHLPGLWFSIPEKLEADGSQTQELFVSLHSAHSGCWSSASYNSRKRGRGPGFLRAQISRRFFGLRHRPRRQTERPRIRTTTPLYSEGA